MNLTSTTHQPHPGIDQPAGPAHALRPLGAGRAQGFAQVMQAFVADPVRHQEPSPPATVAQDSETDPAAGKAAEQGADQSVDQSVDQGADQAPADVKESRQEPQAAGDAAPTDVDASQNTDPQAQPQADASVNTTDASVSDDSPTLEREASMRLLRNQSDQAKLSIKGLVDRTLTHAAGVSLTDIAVDTRLGRDETVAQVPSDTPGLTDPATKPRPSAQSAPHAPQSPAQNPPQSPTPHLSGVPNTVAAASPGGASMAGPTAQTPVDDAPDQARTDVQQVRSTRADAGVASQTMRPLSASDQAAQTRLETTGQVARAVRGDSAQSVRAVTAGESAPFGAPLKDSTGSAGSLVEKMSRPAVPEGADRGALLAQVQRGMASLLRSGKGDMTLKLIPANLGEIKIKIKSLGDRLSVRFEASTEQGREMLKGGIDDLAAQLRSKGVQLGQLSIEHRDVSSQAPAHTPGQAQSGPGAAHDQGGHHQPTHDQPGAETRHGPGGHLHPDEHNTDQPLAGQPGPIWTELGLDAIA